MPADNTGCCTEFQCLLPAFACNCQADCFYASRHQDPDHAIDPDTYYDECIATGIDIYGPCDEDDVLPDIMPLEVALKFADDAIFPTQPALFDSTNLPSSMQACYDACYATAVISEASCDSDYSTCFTGCGGGSGCIAACKSTRADCYKTAFDTAATCSSPCLNKTALKQTFGVDTDCQNGETEAEPDDGKEFARCLRYVGKVYVDDAWTAVGVYASALAACNTASGLCFRDAMITPADCGTADHHCRETAYAVFLRTLEPFGEQWSIRKAQCLRDWMASTGTVDGQIQPLQKHAYCEWQWLWLRKEKDLIFTDKRLLCEADLYDCDTSCELIESDILSHPGMPTCAALCNLASIVCMYEVRRDWVDDRIEACRKSWSRFPPRGNHQAGEWCRGQCDAMDTECTELFNTAVGSCYYTCCGQPDIPGCMADCDTSTAESQPFSLCATALSDCVGYFDSDGNRIGCPLGSDVCMDNCWNTYRDCIFSGGSDWSVCLKEGRTRDYAAHGDPPDVHNYCKEIGCARLMPDCPSCLAFTPDDFLLGTLGIADPLGQNRFWSMAPATSPMVSLTGCD